MSGPENLLIVRNVVRGSENLLIVRNKVPRVLKAFVERQVLELIFNKRKACFCQRLHQFKIHF